MAKSKSSSKSRTSSSKKKNLKLKWWYVLPVVAIVAVAGYAIVSFSEAATYKSPRTISAGNLNCTGGTKVDKQGTYGRSCNITNAAGVSSSANWNHYTNLSDNYGSTGNFCATVFFSNGATISIRSQLKGTTIADSWSALRQVTKTTGGYYEVCDGRGGGYFSAISLSDSARLEIKNISGGVTVVRMYVK
jgi:hypothetical protein